MILLGLRRYGQQPKRYIFDTDLADMMHTRYDIDVHDLRFRNQDIFFISTTK